MEIMGAGERGQEKGWQAEHVPSPLDVLIQLYEGAIDFLERSVEACEDGRVDEFKDLLQRGRLIIEEFQKTLDFTQGGQVPAQLNDLYEFMLESLSQADLTHDHGEEIEVARPGREKQVELAKGRLALSKAQGVDHGKDVAVVGGAYQCRDILVGYLTLIASQSGELF